MDSVAASEPCRDAHQLAQRGTAASRLRPSTPSHVEDQIHRRVGELAGNSAVLPGHHNVAVALQRLADASMVCGASYSASASSPPFESTRFMLWVKPMRRGSGPRRRRPTCGRSFLPSRRTGHHAPSAA